jgi:hypothetical protein
MKAHQLDENGYIVNTIIVDSLDALPGLTLVDASIGGQIGDRIVDGLIVPQPIKENSESKEEALARLASLEEQIAELRAQLG